MDSIDRQAAIDTSLEFFVEFLGGAFEENLQKKLIERINALPSAQPERKTGKWEQKSESSWKDRWSRWKCSACDKHVRISLYDDPIKAGLMFCPSCGAEMLRMEGSNG